MASLQEFLERPIPRPLFWVATPLLAILLTLTFIFLGFPYSELIPAASRLSGSEAVRVGHIQPLLTVGGPGFSLRDITFGEGAMESIGIDRLKIRPAWATSWLSGEPAFAIEMMSPAGEADGIFTWNDARHIEGEVAIPDLAVLPLPSDIAFSLAGSLKAKVSLDVQPLTGNQAEGEIQFEALAGSATHTNIPMPMEFDAFSGRIKLGGESGLMFETIEIDGPTFSADAEGFVNLSQANRPAMMDLDFDLHVKNPGLRMLLSGLGLRFDESGHTTFNVGGSIQNPVVR